MEWRENTSAAATCSIKAFVLYGQISEGNETVVLPYLYFSVFAYLHCLSGCRADDSLWRKGE
jgi:hypothetical protein